MVDISKYIDENGRLRLSGGYSGPTCYRVDEREATGSDEVRWAVESEDDWLDDD